MNICFNEPTIEELLNDSLTQGIMRADRVDAAALRGMLQMLALSIEERISAQRVGAPEVIDALSGDRRTLREINSAAPVGFGREHEKRAHIPKHIEIQDFSEEYEIITVKNSSPDRLTAGVLSLVQRDDQLPSYQIPSKIHANARDPQGSHSSRHHSSLAEP